MSNQAINEQPLSDIKPCSNKFMRRHNVTPAIRLYIAATALIAQTNRTWGKIIELSR